MIVSLLTLGLLLIPSSNAFFRMPCAKPVLDARVDPIVSTGKPSSHSHTIMGSNAIGLSTTFNDLRNSECTTCKVKDDKSAYWVPELYYQYKNGSFQVVTHGGMIVYYLQRNAANETVEAFPDGLRMLAGNPYTRSNPVGKPESTAISWKCIDFNGPDHPETPGFGNMNCPSGLRAQLFFPACWDGVNLDSPDHKSHMAYPDGVNNGLCPFTHPHHLVSIFYEVWFNVGSFVGLNDGGRFVLANGDPTGYGLHGDFMNGWDRSVLSRAVKTCTANSGVIEDCPVFQNEGRFVSDADMNKCSAPNPLPLEKTVGPVPHLPGCVAVTGGPGPATAADLVPGCSSGNPVLVPPPPQNTSSSSGTPSSSLVNPPPSTMPAPAHSSGTPSSSPANPPPSTMSASVLSSGSPSSSPANPPPSTMPASVLSSGSPSSSPATPPPSTMPASVHSSGSPSAAKPPSSSTPASVDGSGTPSSSPTKPPPSTTSTSANATDPSGPAPTSTPLPGPASSSIASKDPGSVSPTLDPKPNPEPTSTSKPSSVPPKDLHPSSLSSSSKPEPTGHYHHHHHHHHHHHGPQHQDDSSDSDMDDCDESPPATKNASVPMRRRHHARRAGHGGSHMRL